MKVLLQAIVFLLMTLLIPKAFAQSATPHEIEMLYSGLVKSFTQLPPANSTPEKDFIYLKYGKEEIPLRHSAFSSLIQQVTQASVLAHQATCQSCKSTEVGNDAAQATNCSHKIEGH